MSPFNLSALAVREKSVTLFMIVTIAVAAFSLSFTSAAPKTPLLP